MLLFAEPGAGATTAEPKTTTMKVHAVRGRGIDFTRRSSGGQSRTVGAYPSLWGAGTCAVTPRHIRDGECVSSAISTRFELRECAMAPTGPRMRLRMPISASVFESLVDAFEDRFWNPQILVGMLASTFSINDQDARFVDEQISGKIVTDSPSFGNLGNRVVWFKKRRVL